MRGNRRLRAVLSLCVCCAVVGCDDGGEPRDQAVSAATPGDSEAPDSSPEDAADDTTDDTLTTADVTDDVTSDTSVGDSSAEDADAEAADADADTTPAVSTYCGDGIRDDVTEECDDGLGADAGPRRACTADCKVLDLLAVPVPAGDAGLVTPGRTLGNGRHPIAGSSAGFAVAFVEPDATPVRVALTTFDAKGVPSDLVVPFGAGTGAVIAANPVLAAVPGGWAAAWTDFGGDGDGLGVALRLVNPGAPSSGAPAHANLTIAFAQHDPDVVVTAGGEVVVAWVDDSNVARSADLKVRRFSSSLAPLSGEDDLAITLDAESDVALATFGSGWAAAWRAARGGLESIQVKAGTATWSLGPFLAGPYGAKPALVELDASHLLVAFVQQVDPGDAGPPGGFELRAAVLDVATPGPASALTVPTGAGLDVREVNAVRVAGRVYLAWREDAPSESAKGEELWLKDVGWSAGALDLTQAPIALPRWAEHRAGDQRRAALAGIGSALAAGWDDLGRTFAGAWSPDVVVQMAAVPVLRVIVDGGS